MNRNAWPCSRRRAAWTRWALAVLAGVLACVVVRAPVARAADDRRARKPVRIGDPVPQVLAPPPPNEPLPTAPALEPPRDPSAFAGRTITRVEIAVDDDAWHLAEPPQVASVRAGQTMSGAAVRRAIEEVLQSGRFAKARVVALDDAGGVRLVVHVVQRRLIESLRLDLHGAPVDRDDLLREADLSDGGEVIGVDLPEYRRRMERTLARRGYPDARVSIASRETDDPTRVIVLVDVQPGPPRLLGRRAFYVFGAESQPLSNTLRGYRVDVGARADEAAIDAADAALEARLRARGFHRADVSHDVVLASGIVTLRVRVDAGPRFVARFEGNDHYDASALSGALALDTETDFAPSHLVQKVEDFYVKRGFLDVEVTLETRGAETDRVHQLVFHVAEHRRVTVQARTYPCLKVDEIRKLSAGGPTSVSEIGSEIDSYLEEELPGADLIVDPDPKGLDATIRDPAGVAEGRRAEPIDLDPDRTYAADTYERAVEHVQELYRNEGYLHAQVGPVQVLRRQCAKRSPAGGCIPITLPTQPPDVCAYDASNLPLPVPPLDPSLTCTPDPAHGIECEPQVTLRIPIKLGPRTTLWDVQFEGARVLAESRLARAAAIDLGQPANTLKIDEARRRIVDLYKEEGYAYADVKYALDTSADHTRGRVRFQVTEGDQVIVKGIVIRGNDVTNEGTIRRRIALEVGGPYRTSGVRKTQERIATLGVFSNVGVALEEPYVPQKSKVVVITVTERKPQYVELRPGFSTGEGIRGAFEYGHANIAGDAISLGLRAMASYLPDELIFDDTVRANFDTLSRGFSSKRLAARVTASLGLPEIGLGPLVRTGIDGVYVHDLERDFVLTKFAAIPSVTYRPIREVQLTLSQSFERNEVQIIEAGIPDVTSYLVSLGTTNADLARLLRVPNGASYAFAQKFVVSWDRRDNSFDAHRGTFFSSGIEHIDWYGLQSATATFGHTLRFTEVLAGYIPLGKRLTLAAALRMGNNVQLVSPSRSTTYPDRFFFLGGTDSVRGWYQDSLMPQEDADKIAADASKPDPDPSITDPTARCKEKFTYNCVPVRGGNLMLNPKIELRIPVVPPFGTVLFVDAGNVWLDPNDLFDRGISFRYGTGTGIRYDTPIGPLALDFGLNLSRLFESPTNPRRTYEQPFNIHFAIGLF